MATSPIEVRLAHLEGAFEQIHARLATIEDRLGRFADKVDSRFGRLEDKIDHQFYWILSLVVLSILVPAFLRILNP